MMSEEDGELINWQNSDKSERDKEEGGMERWRDGKRNRLRKGGREEEEEGMDMRTILVVCEDIVWSNHSIHLLYPYYIPINCMK